MTDATNTHLGSLPVGAIFRSYRHAPTTWRIDGIDDGRVYCHSLYDVRRVTDCSPAMSVWAIRNDIYLAHENALADDVIFDLYGRIPTPYAYTGEENDR